MGNHVDRLYYLFNVFHCLKCLRLENNVYATVDYQVKSDHRLFWKATDTPF